MGKIKERGREYLSAGWWGKYKGIDQSKRIGWVINNKIRNGDEDREAEFLKTDYK